MDTLVDDVNTVSTKSFYLSLEEHFNDQKIHVVNIGCEIINLEDEVVFDCSYIICSTSFNVGIYNFWSGTSTRHVRVRNFHLLDCLKISDYSFWKDNFPNYNPRRFRNGTWNWGVEDIFSWSSYGTFWNSEEDYVFENRNTNDCRSFFRDFSRIVLENFFVNVPLNFF